MVSTDYSNTTINSTNYGNTSINSTNFSGTTINSTNYEDDSVFTADNYIFEDGNQKLFENGDTFVY